MTAKKMLQAREPDSAPLERKPNPPRRILVVDDEPYIRQPTTEVLIRSNYHVDAVEDGAAAWEALKANSYNLLITEHELRTLTGIELIKMLRAARVDVPVVMAAGRLPTHELARNPSLQLAATLSKPFVIDALLDTVRNVLRATDSAQEPVAPLPIGRSQPSADGLWL